MSKIGVKHDLRQRSPQLRDVRLVCSAPRWENGGLFQPLNDLRRVLAVDTIKIQRFDFGQRWCAIKVEEKVSRVLVAYGPVEIALQTIDRQSEQLFQSVGRIGLPGTGQDALGHGPKMRQLKRTVAFKLLKGARRYSLNYVVQLASKVTNPRHVSQYAFDRDIERTVTALLLCGSATVGVASPSGALDLTRNLPCLRFI